MLERNKMSIPTINTQFCWTQVAESTPYAPAAFDFVERGLGYTSNLVGLQQENDCGFDELDHHVTGQQLCMGLRDFAIECYGSLAPVVLRHWDVYRTDDFGAIVYHMAVLKLLRTSPQDSIEDFRGVFDFDEAFHQQELRECIGAFE
jgi:uncharacterized repeat protein (TIGR04138 family)